MEERVNADGAEVIVGFEKLVEYGLNFLFGGGEDLIGDEACLVRREAGGWFRGRGGGNPLPGNADFLMAETYESEAALVGWVGLIEKRKFPLFVEPGFDEVVCFYRRDLIGGELDEAASGRAKKRLGEPVGMRVCLDEGLDFCRGSADLGREWIVEEAPEFESEFFREQQGGGVSPRGFLSDFSIFANEPEITEKRDFGEG